MSKINTDPLESFVKLTSNSLFIKKKITFKGRGSQPSFSIQPHNMICTCELRIRETSNYLNNLQLRRQNDCGEAFSFYEVELHLNHFRMHRSPLFLPWKTP